MFENIGEKLQKLAKATCIIGLIASVIGAIVLWGANDKNNPTVFRGFVVLVAGGLTSWIGSFATYGFGKLIEDTEAIRAALRTSPQKSLYRQSSQPSESEESKKWMDIAATMELPDGWTCTCGQANEHTRLYCTKCLRTRGEVEKK